MEAAAMIMQVRQIVPLATDQEKNLIAQRVRMKTMSNIDALSALKIECQISMAGNYAKYNESSAVNAGASVKNIAKRMSSEQRTVSQKECRRELNRLRLAEKVVNLSLPSRSTRWWPVGYLKDLKKIDSKVKKSNSSQFFCFLKEMSLSISLIFDRKKNRDRNIAGQIKKDEKS